jgi:Tol biopolymer transport system component
MLTGRRAFSGETTSDTIAAIIEREPDWTALPAETPPAVRRLLQRCLDKDPKRRLRDIGDATPLLDEAEPVAAREDHAPPVRQSPVGWAGWVVAAVLLLTIAGLGVFWMRSRAAAGPSVSRVVRLTNGPALDYAPAISPDGKWVAYMSDASGPTDVWVKLVAGGDAVNLTASTNVEVAPQVDSGGLSVSPDGTLIAFNAGSRGRQNANNIGTWVVPAPFGGVPRRLLDVGRAARWSPDGTRVAFIVQGGTSGDAIWVADADGANPREIAPRRGGMHKHWPAWSPDGRYVYFNYSVTGNNIEPSEIYRVPAAGGPIEPMVEAVRRAMFPALTSDGTGLVYAANPRTVDLGLWWNRLGAPVAESRKLTVGVGEYSEASLSADNRRLVATLTDYRQALVSVPAAGQIEADRAVALTSGDAGDTDPAVSPDGEHLVFSSTRSGNRNLWTARPDGSQARPLTSGDGIDERPAFSRDGQRIAFVSERRGERGIWLINAEGGSPRLLVKTLVLDTLSWSPDGRRIVYAVPGDAAPRLSLVDVTTGAATPLATPGAAATPVWSPAIDLIAYVENRTVVNAPSVLRLQFIDPSGRLHALPVFPLPPTLGTGILAWQPGGRSLAVVGNSGSLPSVVWIVEPGDASVGRKLIEFPPDTRVRGLTWSHDGASIIFGRQKRSSDIVLMDFDK